MQSKVLGRFASLISLAATALLVAPMIQLELRAGEMRAEAEQVGQHLVQARSTGSVRHA